jgi:hypothetical protein
MRLGAGHAVAHGVVHQIEPSGTAHGFSELVKAHTPRRPSCRNTTTTTTTPRSPPPAAIHSSLIRHTSLVGVRAPISFLCGHCYARTWPRNLRPQAVASRCCSAGETPHRLARAQRPAGPTPRARCTGVDGHGRFQAGIGKWGCAEPAGRPGLEPESYAWMHRERTRFKPAEAGVVWLLRICSRVRGLRRDRRWLLAMHGGEDGTGASGLVHRPRQRADCTRTCRCIVRLRATTLLVFRSCCSGVKPPEL